jgi:predicted DNA-binding transcriptional regulator AlpA
MLFLYFTVRFGCDSAVHEIIRFMDTSQTRIVELLREVHLIAFKEIERLNLRIAELDSPGRQPIPPPPINSPVAQPSMPSKPTDIEVMDERQLSAYLNISVSTVRRWRLIRKGPKFLKIGVCVRYRREEVQVWLESCPGMR